MARRFSRFLYQPCIPLGKDGKRATACEEHISLSRRASTEGMVLLKNEKGALPLSTGERIALFGAATLVHVKGGSGSGDVYTPYARSFYEGMRIKENEGKVKLFHPLADFYKPYVEQVMCDVEKNCEPEIPNELFERASEDADTAIITISRMTGEGEDFSSAKGGFYLTDREQALIDRVCSSFKKVIAILNIGGVIDTEWFAENSKIQGALIAWQAGTEGGLAISDILCGDVNPSGKLADTFAKSYDDYPSSAGFHASDDYVDYSEDIYVGYRYFETIPHAKEKVNYPFGYGLSYTNFKISGLFAFDDKEKITVTATVTNTGTMCGKEVVQVYYSAPQGILGKPAKELAAFKKTKLLRPGESETIALSFEIGDMASYDDLGKHQKSAYLLEKGDYKIFVGTSVRDLSELEYTFTVEEDYRIISQLKSRCAPIDLKSRMVSDGTMEELPSECVSEDYPEHRENTAKTPKEFARLEDVGKKATLDEYIAEFSDEDLAQLVGGNRDIGVSNISSFGGNERLGIPIFPPCDGPAGLRLKEECGIAATMWPCATLIACTWNTDLAGEIGAAGALEVKENNLAVWLTPALNIHRNPICGRNFEYYSEDPLISGKMAAATVGGIQSRNIGASAKHFACNNKETNRLQSDSRVSERALREIYLKGFEICVKESQPWTIMTSFNLINGVHTSENHQLITGILREEWGFEGMLMTDWGEKNNPINEVRAGNDMKMPVGYPEELLAAMEEGILTRGDLEACARRIINLFLKFE